MAMPVEVANTRPPKLAAASCQCAATAHMLYLDVGKTTAPAKSSGMAQVAHRVG